MSRPNLFLVGPMGAGKSTIGRLVADELGVSFFDSDRVIESRSGADIPWIFDVEGEEGFRRRESGVLAELAREPGAVIATGGGVVLRSDNRRTMSESGLVCYLTASLDHLIARTAKDKRRPLLQVDDPEERIRQLLDERDPLYREVADFLVTTDKRSPRGVAQAIVEQVKQRAAV